jgi:pimeloyl-ACP methyl ester carboxylesterase
MSWPALPSPLVPDAPVVLVHGFATSSARTWGENGWLDLLRDAGRDPVPIDLLGHGTAPKPHDPAAYADVERLVAEALPAGPVDAVGFSMGARVLLTLAVEDPSRFSRLVVAGVGANLFRSEGHEVIAAAIEGSGDRENPVAQYFAGLSEHPDADREALAACMRAPRPPLTPELLGRVELPVLVVLGDRDFAGPADPLVDALPDATLVTLRGVDHFATPKDFGFIDAALDFLGAQL